LHEHLLPFKTGFLRGCRTLFLLAKVMVPVIFVLVALEKLALLHYVAQFFEPFLGILGLPGEASVAVLLGFFINIYAAVGAISVLALSPAQITVLAFVILTSHSLLMESSVLKLTGLPYFKTMFLRILAALVFGALLNQLFVLVGRF